MTRRRPQLRCVSSSDDDEHDGRQSHHHLPQPPPSNPTSAASEPARVSDDDFVDVSETFSPPTLPDRPPPQPLNAQVRSTSHSACPIEDLLLTMGVKLRRQWLESCIQELESSVPRFRTLNVAEKAKLCFEQFLFSDMNYSGGGVLPENVASMHLVDLKGPFVLQVDEIVNSSSPLRGRYQDTAPGVKRCLKLSLTDGAQRVFAMEYMPVNDLKVLAPAGLKVAICNVHIRRGLLMLVPEAIEVLGGVVDRLEAARQRLVTEVNKPPRGKRTVAGVLPPLAARATAAAWPGDSANGQTPLSTRATTGARPRDSANEQTNVGFPQTAEHAEQRGAHLVSHSTGVNQTTDRVAAVPNVDLNHSVNSSFRAATVEVMDLDTVLVGRESDASNVASVVEEVHLDRVIRRQSDVSDVASVVGEMHIDSDPPVNREFAASNLSVSSGLRGGGPSILADEGPRSVNRDFAASNLRGGGGLSTLVDEDEPSLIFSESDEVPFTYLTRLSLRLALSEQNVPSVQGKIKGFLTGVKQFHFKQTSRYELLCYVDDGSMISEIFIDHNVVQRTLGYCPEEVTAALSSSDKKTATSMKETMKGFQKYLMDFEGIMVVKQNRGSKTPAVLEMTQGCSASDAWSLLRRLRPPGSARTAEHRPLAPIEISP